MKEPAEATLRSIARGGAQELFGRELDKVLENVRDINTDVKKKRKVTMTFEFVPYEDRSGVQCNIKTKTELAGANGVTGTIFIVKQGQKYRGFTQDIRQGDLFESGDGPDEPGAEDVEPAGASVASRAN